ncbi:hypothetical protein D3C80_1217330 [compost metagenome]
MNRQIFHRPTGLRAANLHAPAVVNKAFHHIGGKSKRRAGPQVFLVIRAFDLLNIVKAAHRYGIRTIWQTTQHARHHQTQVAGIIGIAEGFPLDVFGTVKVVADVLDGRHIFHRCLIKEFRTGRADKRHMGRSGHFRDVTHQRHILGRCVKLVCGNDGRNRLTARGVVFRYIRVCVQSTLDDFRGVFKILT